MTKVYLLQSTTSSDYDDCNSVYTEIIGIYTTKEKAEQAEKELQLGEFKSFEEKQDYINKRNSLNQKNSELYQDRQKRFGEYCKEREKYYNDVFKKEYNVHSFFDGCFVYPHDENSCMNGFVAWKKAPSGRGFGEFENGEFEGLKKQCWAYLQEFNKHFEPFQEPVLEEFDDYLNVFEGKTEIIEYIVQ